MTVAFTQIPSNRRLPGVAIEIDSSQAVRGLPGMPHRVLSIAQKLPSGQTPALEPVLITDPEQAALAFGRGSMQHVACASFRSGNDVTELWAIGLDDAGAGVAAVKSATVEKIDAGEDFGAGTAILWVGDIRVRAAVATDDTPADIAAALVTAATDPLLPATLTAVGAVITSTAKHKGAAGNDIYLRLNHYADERAPSNLKITVAEVTAGAGNPDTAPALAAVAGEWYTGIIFPYTDAANYAALDAFLEERFDAQDQRDGKAYTAHSGSVSELFAWGEGVNSQFVNTVPTMGSPSPPWKIAAAMAAVGEFRFQIDPARQLRTLPLVGIVPGRPESLFDADEKELLLRSGITAMDVRGGAMRIMRAVTNYQVSDLGAEDTAYLDLTTVALLAYLRWSEKNRIELRFPRHKLSNDGTRAGPGQAIATPKIVSGELIALYREWEEAGLVENPAFFVERLIVERAGGDPNRLNSLQTPDLINNFRLFAAMLQFRL